MPSTIEWTTETWNPTVGCSKTSPGCDRCYAISVAHRAMQIDHVGLTRRVDGGHPDWTGEVRQLAHRLATPLKWKEPRRVFVDSMSDLFHLDVDPAFIARVFATMDLTRRHTYQVLTKRPHRARALLADRDLVELVDAARGADAGDFTWPLPNLWVGTSIESDRYTFRADHLRATPAAVRFLSLEPLLGPLPSLDLTGIDWVIIGGESGPGARPMDLAWAEALVDQARAGGVAVFVKQLGVAHGTRHHDIDTFPAGLKVREFPKAEEVTRG